ncbi:MAG: anthranilate synthase component I family protein [Bacteroidales bacterium]|nr:anthranilate synthase component I family protein [Bacteroidales bacterium]
MRKVLSTKVENIGQVKQNLIYLGKLFDYFILLDSNDNAGYESLPPSYLNYQFLAGVGAYNKSLLQQEIFSSIQHFTQQIPDWYFLHLTFEAKTETHGIPTKYKDLIGFPVAFIFSPVWLVTAKNNVLRVQYPPNIDDSEARNFLNKLIKPEKRRLDNLDKKSPINIQQITFKEYKQTFEHVKDRLSRGDIYEMNLCINFFAESVKIDPYSTYLRLNDFSPAPFAAFYKYNDLFLLSASPERFLKKEGNQILSQPIKGTITRGKTADEDNRLREYLKNNQKERSENIMITDLVRNDLSQFAEAGSVEVMELCGIYPFRHVHQMISSIRCNLRKEIYFSEAIKLAFPMGSMTGAPKRNALKYIEQYENFNRGLYSGSLGYITPDGDFDLNVVIRSILYNSTTGNLSIPAGSAVTIYADANNEYQECYLKAKALIEILS